MTREIMSSIKTLIEEKVVYLNLTNNSSVIITKLGINKFKIQTGIVKKQASMDKAISFITKLYSNNEVA